MLVVGLREGYGLSGMEIGRSMAERGARQVPSCRQEQARSGWSVGHACRFDASGLAGIQSFLVPAYGKGVRVVEELPDLDACPLCRVEDRDPALGGVGRMRDEDVGRGIIELLVMGSMLCRRVAQELLKAASTNGNVDAEDAVAIKLRLGVPADIIVNHDGGEGQSLVLGAIPFGVVEEERVTPRRLWRRVLVACGNRHYARLAPDVFDDLGFSHRAMITRVFVAYSGLGSVTVDLGAFLILWRLWCDTSKSPAMNRDSPAET
jgi:hypothetical protein